MDEKVHVLRHDEGIGPLPHNRKLKREGIKKRKKIMQLAPLRLSRTEPRLTVQILIDAIVNSKQGDLNYNN